MTRIAITGNIAGGKSTVAGMMEEAGLAVCDADALAHELMEPGTPEFQAVVRGFGSEVVDAEGRIDRNLLGRLAFADAGRLAELNRILHPGVARKWEAWMARQDPGATVAVQIPQLYEGGFGEGWDAVVCVCASETVRRRRLASRGLGVQDIEQRLAAQWPQDVKAGKADFVIWNDGNRDSLGRQVCEVLKCIRETT